MRDPKAVMPRNDRSTLYSGKGFGMWAKNAERRSASTACYLVDCQLIRREKKEKFFSDAEACAEVPKKEMHFLGGKFNARNNTNGGTC